MIQGIVILIFAAFVWGLGNALTGVTAAKYIASSSLLPSIDISLANTGGGLLLLTGVYIVKRKMSSCFAETDLPRHSDSAARAVVAGVLKGLNTCFFVFSATYVVATHALILESTYIVWSALFGLVAGTNALSRVPTIIRALILSVAVLLVSGLRLSTGSANVAGLLFGLLAGATYAGFLHVWSSLANGLSSFELQSLYTMRLLAISSVTIVGVTEMLVGVFHRHLWVPFTYIEFSDTVLQVANGTCVVGVVYLLITVGMRAVDRAGGNSGTVAAFCLSLSIPFTLLTEVWLGRVFPTLFQLFGIGLFVICFVSLKIGSSPLKTGGRTMD